MARRPKAKPAATPALDPALIDRAALIAALRRDDGEQIQRAYRQVFRGDVGRLVLAHLLKEAGVGKARPRDMDANARTFMDGAAFTAIAVAEQAGFDQVSVVLAAFTDEIEGPTDDRSGQYGGSPDGGDGSDGY